MGGALTVRAATPEDGAAISTICLLTGANGGDATGDFCDDAVISDVYATPYTRGPGGFGLVWDEGTGPLGYVLGTRDTRAFQEWFVSDWWPSLPEREQRTEGDLWLLPSGPDPYRMLIPELDEYPAHLHIDLLPEAQGQGWGRRLIEMVVSKLTAREVPGLHLAASTENRAAIAFYPRVGFAPIPSHSGVQAFGMHLAPNGPTPSSRA